MKNRTLWDYFILFFKGVLMGIANKIPGVSGGMVALVTNFYEELMNSFKKINSQAFQLFFTGQFTAFAQYINLKFLFAIHLGSLFSVFSFSLGLDWLIDHYQAHVWGFFFGLILGSIYYLRQSINRINKSTVLTFFLSAAIGLGVTFMDPLPPNDNLAFIALCGLVSTSGIPLPGFSGSFLLILLGNYELILVDSVNNIFYIFKDLLSGDYKSLQDPEKIHLLKIALVALISSITGLITLAKIISFLLKKHHDKTITALIGFITGSLGVAWPWKKPIYHSLPSGEILLDTNQQPLLKTYQRFIPSELNLDISLTLVFIFLGTLLVLGLYFLEQKKKTNLNSSL